MIGTLERFYQLAIQLISFFLSLVMPVTILAREPVKLAIPTSIQEAILQNITLSAGWSMNRVPPSGLSGPQCEWIQNRPLKTLNQALVQFRQALGEIKSCQNDPSFNNVVTQLQNLEKISAYFKNYSNALLNPDAFDPSLIANFQANIQLLLNSLNQVFVNFDNLVNRPKGECSAAISSNLNVLLAISDFVSSLAPFMIIGAAMNPSFKVSLPVILGVTSLGSIIKLYQSMKQQNSLDVTKPEIRQVLLENLCEFEKVYQRVRLVRWAQAGYFDQIDAEIRQKENRLQAELRNPQDPTLIALKTFESQTRSRLKEISNYQAIFVSQLDAIEKEFQSFSPDLICAYMKKSIGKNDSIFSQIGALYQRLWLLQEKPTSHQEHLYELFNENFNGIQQAQTVDECFAKAQSLLALTRAILNDIRTSISELEKQLESFLTQNPSYVFLRDNTQRLNAEIEQLKAIRKILVNLKSTGGLMDEVEMNILYSQIKKTFLESSSGLPGFKRLSPARTWLEFMWNFSLQYEDLTRMEFRELQNIAYRLTPSGKGDIYKRNARGEIEKDWLGQPKLKSFNEIVRQHQEDAQKARRLESLVPPDDPKELKFWKPKVCRHLENGISFYGVIINFIQAGLSFCNFIRPFFDASTDKQLLKFCEGKETNPSQTGVLLGRLQELQSQKWNNRLNLLKERHQLWQCPLPMIVPLN